MPVIQQSDYKAPFYLFNAHLQTIIPGLFRKVDGVKYQRERIVTADNDFLDLDWSCKGNNRIAILSHGLEGDSQRPYIKGMVKELNTHGWDALAWNFRGCGGEINKNLRFYHSGATEDLEEVIAHALQKKSYESIVLIGFSLGGNLTLKYLGERGKALRSQIKRSVVFSVPCDLQSGSTKMAGFGNKVYMSRFLKHLRKKVQAKALLMPGQINDKDYHLIKTFKDFDDKYTAPLHGFKDAVDYWTQCSSKHFLKGIAVPTLIVNAKNDPFLSPECFPFSIVNDLPHVYLEAPEEGGHCGFYSNSLSGKFWSEERAIKFLEGLKNNS
jgi:predicted alpha/beta-fold hydrolase